MEDQFWFKVCQNGPHSSSITSIVSILADLFIVLFTMVDFLLPLIVQNVGSFDVAAIFRLLRMFRAIRALRALRVLRTIRLEIQK